MNEFELNRARIRTESGQKNLDRWAHEAGYSDFDTFVRTGGTILDAARDIAKRIRSLQDALRALPMDPRYLDDREPYLRDPILQDATGMTGLVATGNAPAAVAGIPSATAQTEDKEAAADAEPVETDNAQIQGAELP